MKKLADIDFRTFYEVNEYVAKTTPMRTHYHSKNSIERWIWTRKKQIIHEFLQSIPYETVLDVGCGDGGLFGLLSGKAQYTGIDISPTQLAAFRSQIKKLKVKSSPTLIEADITKLPLKDASFDLALACDVLEHVLDPEKVLREFKRVVKKDGYIIFSIPNEPLLQLSRLMTLRFPLRSPDHLYAITVQDVKTFFPHVVGERGIPLSLFNQANLINMLLVTNDR